MIFQSLRRVSRHQFRGVVDFIKYHQLVLVQREIGFRVTRFRPVGRGFKIEIYAGPTSSDSVRKCGLPDLPRPEQCRGGLTGGSGFHRSLF